VNFDGTAAITVAAAAGTLTGATLAAGVLASSLTSVGILAAPHFTTPVIDSGGLTITAGGLNVAAGGATISGPVNGITSLAIGGALTGATTGAFSGAVSMGALTATTGTFSGAVQVAAAQKVLLNGATATSYIWEATAAHVEIVAGVSGSVKLISNGVVGLEAFSGLIKLGASNLQWGSQPTATGASTPAVIGNINTSGGPFTAAQGGWIMVADSLGVNFFIPVWR
jgi:hypothetical protein